MALMFQRSRGGTSANNAQLLIRIHLKKLDFFGVPFQPQSWFGLSIHFLLPLKVDLSFISSGDFLVVLFKPDVSYGLTIYSGRAGDCGFHPALCSGRPDFMIENAGPQCPGPEALKVRFWQLKKSSSQNFSVYDALKSLL